MRTPVASLLLAALVAAPAAARAEGSSTPVAGGAIQGGRDTLNRCQLTGARAAALAGVAAPVIVAGAAYTIVAELRAHAAELHDVPYTQPSSAGGQQPNLNILPEVADRYREGPNGERPRAQPTRAFELNERATNVATAVASAAVIGAIIATIAKH